MDDVTDNGCDVRLKARSLQQLLQLDSAINAELRRRGLVRSNNRPLGDIDEAIVAHARGGILENNSTKSYDIKTPAGELIQVKACTVSNSKRTVRFSLFRSFNFDSAVFLVFDAETWHLKTGFEVSAEAVKEVAKWVGHTNGFYVTLPKVRQVGVDVSDEMRESYAEINNTACERAG